MDVIAMDKLYGIILTLIAGLFFLIGGLISLKAKDKDKLNHFSVSLALIIMLGLICKDLFPEIIELLEDTSRGKSIIIIIISSIIGFIILKILDLFIPDHHHEHHDNEKNKKEHLSHIEHIGILTIISLILHNIIEGFAIFGISNTNFKIGLLTSISVALHNIPLGTHIFGYIDIKHNKVLIGALTLSSLLGGLIFLLVGDISNLVLASITYITLGMIIYIAFFELLPEVITNIKKKETKLGFLTGLIILVISLFI